MNKKVIKICGDCGLSFLTTNHSAKRCPKCQEKAKAKKRAEAAKKKLRKAPAKSLNQIMRELAEYNRENGTYLTYGQYVNMTEGGK